jgi:hypothetical protein
MTLKLIQDPIRPVAGLASNQAGKSKTVQHPDTLASFESILLDDLGRAGLMDRQETKYVFKDHQLAELLFSLQENYKVLEIRGSRISAYKTVYYDTNDLLFFQQHHNGAGHRWKVRQRTYLDTGQDFLELKFKDNRRRTWKSRKRISSLEIWQATKDDSFIRDNSPFSLSELYPTLEVNYFRTTLVQKDHQERITLDSQLVFSNSIIFQELNRLMIAEVKQASFDPKSPFLTQIKNCGIRPSPFSKYCIGMSMLYPWIKHNRFKPILHRIKALTNGGDPHEWTQ